MTKLVYFDLEGPLSPQDNAYEVIASIERGKEMFEVISRYDDLLALEGRENYEAGDTLSLIAPFLVSHKINEDDISRVSSRAMLVPGAKEMIEKLLSEDWLVYIISTSYEQHAHSIGSRLGIPISNIASTRFPLNSYLLEFGEEDIDIIRQAEKDILELYPPENDVAVKERLDRFFFAELTQRPVGKVIEKMSVCGGARKIDALLKIAEQLGEDVSNSIVIGDSITDMKMLQFVKEKGGIAVVFNGNQYAVPYGNVGLATRDMRNLQLIMKKWEEGGKSAVIEAVTAREGEGVDPYYHVLEGRKNFDDVLEVHMAMREAIRGQAAKLG
ncbi:MAG: HAD family hydrolase [Thermoplasmata archaeon]